MTTRSSTIQVIGGPVGGEGQNESLLGETRRKKIANSKCKQRVQEVLLKGEGNEWAVAGREIGFSVFKMGEVILPVCVSGKDPAEMGYG